MVKKNRHKKIKFQTINQQMDILKNRGLIFRDEKKSARYLLTSNYYNIINGYSKYFQKNPTDSTSDQYIENANFDEVSHLYFFDKEIKQTIFNSILHAEHHLKSIFAYRFAEAYPNKKYAYLDIQCYDPKNQIGSLKVISKLSHLIETKIKYKDDVITHYAKKYNDVPVWVLVDSLDFGTLAQVIQNLPTTIQNKIALDLTDFISENLSSQISEGQKIAIWPPETMNLFIKNIIETRNVCAHNNRLLNFTCRSDSSYYSTLHDLYGITKKSERRSPFTTIITLQCFLSGTEYAILYNTLRKKSKYLSKHLNSIDANDILASLGFPKNWTEKPKKIQKN